MSESLPDRSNLVAGRWETHTQVSYEGKAGCRDIRCRQADGAPTCGGYHCHLCHEPTSAYGHYVEARYIGDVRRRLVGGGAFSCQPGFDDIPLEPEEEG